MNNVFRQIKEIVEKELSCSAHDMEHINRVYNLCIKLVDSETDMEVLKAAALLHDIARVKEDNDNTGKTCHALLSSEMAVPILKELNFSDEKIKHIQDCIISHRYRTGNKAKTKEAKILFDADKLDTLGAIGIARCYIWVGRNNAKIYTNVNIKNYMKDNLGGVLDGRIQDKTKHSPFLEFETKIRFLVNKLYTEKAKIIGKERLEFFKCFLNRMEKEVKGEL